MNLSKENSWVAVNYTMDEFVDLFSEPTTVNEMSPAASVASTASAETQYQSQQATFELFLRWKDDITPVYLHLLLENSWRESPADTLRIIIHCRNCRAGEGGRGLRDQFYEAMAWLGRNHRDALIEMIPQIPNFGYWKDLWNIWDRVDELCRATILLTVCGQIKRDMRRVLADHPVSLVGKWAPSVKRGLDKQFGMVGLICEQLGWSKREYKQNIGMLREKLGVTERLVCQNRIGDINFYAVPAKSLWRHTKTFINWCVDSGRPGGAYLKYVLDPRSDRLAARVEESASVATEGTPDIWQILYWIVSQYTTVEIDASDKLEALWKDAVEAIIDMADRHVLFDTIPVIDSSVASQQCVGGNTRSRTNAFAIALVISSLNGGKVIVCDASAYKIVVLDNSQTLFDRLQALRDIVDVADTATATAKTISSSYTDSLLSAMTEFPKVVILSLENWRAGDNKHIKNILTVDKAISKGNLPSNPNEIGDAACRGSIITVLYWNLSHIAETQSLEFFPNPIASNVDLTIVNGISSIAVNEFLMSGELTPYTVFKSVLCRT